MQQQQDKFVSSSDLELNPNAAALYLAAREDDARKLKAELGSKLKHREPGLVVAELYNGAEIHFSEKMVSIPALITIVDGENILECADLNCAVAYIMARWW